MRLLVVEDERDLNSIICKKLTAEGYNVDSCYDGDAALEYLLLEEYDGAILDIMIPGCSGLDILKTLRKKGNQIPIMFLTAKSDTADIVEGLDSGASDYMVKPFTFPELLARIRVMLRAQTENNENVYKCGPLTLEVNLRTAYRDGKELALTQREYAILEFLVRNRNIIVTREQIRSNIWNIENDVSSNVIDVYIRYLRKKLDDGYEEKLIQTIRGTGYVFKC